MGRLLLCSAERPAGRPCRDPGLQQKTCEVAAVLFTTHHCRLPVPWVVRALKMVVRVENHLVEFSLTACSHQRRVPGSIYCPQPLNRVQLEERLG